MRGGFAVGPTSGPHIQAMDGTGLLAGPLEEGVGFLDSSTMRTGAIGSQFTNGYLDPATGPNGGGTPTSWSVPNTFGPITDVYFGSQKANSVSASSGAISVTTPPGAAGPADVYALASDGGVQLLPEAFSYGPTVLEVTPNAATADGGTGVIYGYGLGPIGSTAVPSDLEVSVGGELAPITDYGNGASYTIPAGLVGSADVTVSTSSGSVTVHNGMTYLPRVQQFPLSGSALAQGIYDSHRNVYYFTDATSVRVFSKTGGHWLFSIPIPPAGTSQRLWGIALSPDGSKLAIADAAGAVIYVLDPDIPSAIKTFSVPQPFGASRWPIGVAISDAGIVYFTALTGGSGFNAFFKLDTSAGQVTDYGIPSQGVAANYSRTVISVDNSRVYSNDDGRVFVIETATDGVSYAKTACLCGDYDLSLSGNQTRFAAAGYFYDSSLNGQSYLALNLREMVNTSYLYGEKLSPDGSLLFQPTTDGIDVLDARLGNLLTRISLPIALSPNYDALVSSGKDNILVAITGTNGDGIAVIDLTSLSVPSLLPYAMVTGPAHLLVAARKGPSTRHNERRRDPSIRYQPGSGKHTVRHLTTRTLLHGL